MDMIAANYFKPVVSADPIERIKEIRRVHKLTQTYVANLLGVNQADVSNFENYRWNKMSLRALVKLLDYSDHELGLSILNGEISRTPLQAVEVV